MRNFTKVAKLHRMFFKRADSFNSYESGDKGQGKYKPSPPGGPTPDGPKEQKPILAAPKPVPNADDWLGDIRSRNTRANSNITTTPAPSSASGHEVMTKRNLGISPIPPKPSPVTIHPNQGLTPKPWTPRQPVAHPRPFKSLDDPGDFSPNDTGEMIMNKIMASDESHARLSRAMQADAQRILASPYGHLQSNGEVLRGFRYPIDGGAALPDNGNSEFEEKSLANRPKLPPRKEDRVNNLQ